MWGFFFCTEEAGASDRSWPGTGIPLRLPGGRAANPGPYCALGAHFGGYHTYCVFLHPLTTDPRSKEGCARSSEAGVLATRWPRGHAWDQSRWSRDTGSTHGTALVTQLIAMTAAAVKGFKKKIKPV